jgi:hypothetical protein
LFEVCLTIKGLFVRFVFFVCHDSPKGSGFCDEQNGALPSLKPIFVKRLCLDDVVCPCTNKRVKC